MSGPQIARRTPAMCLASPSHATWRRSMTDTEIQDFVTRFAAAWAARDGNAFIELWHPEGLLHTPLVNRAVAGSELNRLMQVQTAAAPGFVWQLLDWTSRGDVVIIEWQTKSGAAAVCTCIRRLSSLPATARFTSGVCSKPSGCHSSTNALPSRAAHAAANRVTKS